MTEFIAEIGGNHQGDESRLIELTVNAISNGIKILKYQIYTGESLVNRKYDPQRAEHFESFTLSDSVYKEIIDICQKNSVEFMASIWSESLLNEFDFYLKRYKIGSGDLTNYPLIELMAKRGKPIILSTGLCDISEVSSCVSFIRSINKYYNSPKALSLLQCTSAYPCPIEEVNMKVMNQLRSLLKSNVGYSHHTVQYSPIYIAISMGADLIEFHYTDKKHDNSFRDHLISIDALEFTKILAYYNEVHIIHGNSDKTPTKTEISSLHTKSFRRSLFYKEGFAKGHLITPNDLLSLRPVIGVPSNEINNVINNRLNIDVERGHAVTYEQFSRTKII
jgi:N,N'-diacetyllegionaminate synthase